MPIKVRNWVDDAASDVDPAVIVRVAELARGLETYLLSIEGEIDAAHRPDAQSKTIQDLVGTWLESVGFHAEYLTAFLETPGSHSRPDFYFDLGKGRGILAEVERGGAVNNNHDLKDIWKCHLSEQTQHLFLLVPNRNFKRTGEKREAPFMRCEARLATFFQSRRTRVDVSSLWLFGYGPDELAPGEPPPVDVIIED